MAKMTQIQKDLRDTRRYERCIRDVFDTVRAGAITAAGGERIIMEPVRDGIFEEKHRAGLRAILDGLSSRVLETEESLDMLFCDILKVIRPSQYVIVNDPERRPNV